eukprot:2955005-Amphidinium_carterae.1
MRLAKAKAALHQVQLTEEALKEIVTLQLRIAQTALLLGKRKSSASALACAEELLRAKEINS